jgi:adenosine deaminase
MGTQSSVPEIWPGKETWPGKGTRMLPVAELHVHIEGTLEPELLVSLAARNDVALPATDAAELRARYQFDDLQSFLDPYYANLRVLRQEQDFFDLASAYLTRAAAAGVRRAEIFFDPQTHVGNGVPLEALAVLARNSFDACFAPEQDKRRWHAEVDTWLAASAGQEPRS